MPIAIAASALAFASGEAFGVVVRLYRPALKAVAPKRRMVVAVGEGMVLKSVSVGRGGLWRVETFGGFELRDLSDQV